VPSERLDREEYDDSAMMAQTYRDLDQLMHFIIEAKKFESGHDDKVQTFIRLLWRLSRKVHLHLVPLTQARLT